MARDQRTRLNAELAEQYNSGAHARGAKQPGKDALTENLAAGEIEQAQVEEGDVEEQDVLADDDQKVAAEPKTSLFELPRKEVPRPALLPDVAALARAPATETPSSTSAATPVSKPASNSKK